MNSTFFMVISIVVVFLLLLLFFQTSCDNTYKNNEISDNDYDSDSDSDYDSDSDLFQSTNSKAILYTQVDNQSVIDIKYSNPKKNIIGLKTTDWTKMETFQFDSDFEEIIVKATNTGGPGGLIAKIRLEGHDYLMTNNTKKRLQVMEGQRIVRINDKYGNVGGWRSRTNSNLRSSNWIRGRDGRVLTIYTLHLIGRPVKKKEKNKTKKLNLIKLPNNINPELHKIMHGQQTETFQNSNNNTNNNANNNSDDDSVGQLTKILSGESDANLGIYRFETNVAGVPNENQYLLPIGNFTGPNPITKGFKKTENNNKYTKWVGYMYCKEPKYYRFFLEANCGTVRISKNPLPIHNVKQLFQIDDESLTNGKKQQQNTTFEDEAFNAKEVLIHIGSPRDYYFSGGKYARKPPSLVPKSKLKALKHGIYRIEILTWKNNPINFYYTNNSNLYSAKIYENKSQYYTEPYLQRFTSWAGPFSRTLCCRRWRIYWKEFKGFEKIRKDLKTISYSIEEPLTFFNFGETNQSRFPGGKEGIVKLQYDNFQNTNPANIISEKYAIQKLGRTRNITFSNQFLIEFDIKVKGTVSIWSNIFRITASNNNNSGRLDRIVAMWLYGNSTKVHLRTSNSRSKNYGDDNKIKYKFDKNVSTRISIFTKLDQNNDRQLTFKAQQFDDDQVKIGIQDTMFNNIGKNTGNSDVEGKMLQLIISDKFHPPTNAELRNFTFSTATGPTSLNYKRRISELSYKSSPSTNNVSVFKDTTIINHGIMPKNFVYQISISDLNGDSGEVFSVNKRTPDGKIDHILSDREPVMVLIRDTVNQFRLIWNKFSEKSNIQFIVENTESPNTFKFLFLLTESRMSIFQDVGRNNYVGLVKAYPIDNGSVFEEESKDSTTSIYLCGPGYNNNSSRVNSYTLNPIPKFLSYNKEHPLFKYLDPSFKCEDLTNEGQDKCGPGGTISARLNKECKWYNPNNAERLLEPLNLEEPNEFSKFKKHTDEKFGENIPICINSIHTKKCFMQDPTKGECQDLPCIIHPHESGKPICLHMKDKPKVELTQPNQFNVDINPKFPISTIAAIENPDNSKIEDLSQVINNQSDKLKVLSNEIDRLETIEAFSNLNNQGNDIDKIQSINQATTLFASPMENNETSFKLHVNGKCVTVYDKEKLLLTECQPNLVGHGFKKNKINNNLIAKVETGIEPIMSDSNYPYPYEMIKSDLTSQCLNIDLKNNLTMQDCNPDKVDQFFRSHYTQKS